MRIQIIGASGTGKSTLGKYIADKEHIKWIDTDNYIWKNSGFEEIYALEEQMQMYTADITTFDSYIASGSVFGWYPNGFTNRDLLVFLSLDEAQRMDRLVQRERERGIELFLDEDGNYTNDFLAWCKTYYTDLNKDQTGTYAEHLHQIKISQSPVLKLDSSHSLATLYEQIKQEITQLEKK